MFRFPNATRNFTLAPLGLEVSGTNVILPRVGGRNASQISNNAACNENVSAKTKQKKHYSGF